MRALALVVLLAACDRASETRTSPQVTAPPVPADARPPPALDAAVASACPDPTADAQARGAELSTRSSLSPFDPDGDGAPDPLFEKYCIRGNCEYLIYGCGVYLGAVHGSMLSSPRCEEPITQRPCRIVIGMMMVHGEHLAELYDFVNGTYEHTGSGELYGTRYPKDP